MTEEATPQSTPSQPQPQPDETTNAKTTEKKKVKQKPDNLVIPPPKPKMTKAERRALQEQQRAAKAAAAGGGGGPGSGGSTAAPVKQPQPSAKGDKPSSSSSAGATTTQQPSQGSSPKQQQQSAHSISLVSHLTPYYNSSSSATTTTTTGSSSRVLHPAVIHTGQLYATGACRGGNARCRAMLSCFAILLQDWQAHSTPTTATATNTSNNNNNYDLRTALDHDLLKPAFTYWTEQCRPHSVSMGNAFTFLKSAVASLDRDVTLPQAKDILIETMQHYERERIDFADQVIVKHAMNKIVFNQQHQQLDYQLDNRDKQQDAATSAASVNSNKNGDRHQVILTFGYGQVIEQLLKSIATTMSSSSSSSSLRVIIVDSRPLLEGKILLKQLRQAGIDCTYVLLNALSYVLEDVTTVFLGASALMSDGSIMGRVGTASVALAAHAHHIPVLVCCETYKISNRVQLDSLTGNELGDTSSLLLLPSSSATASTVKAAPGAKNTSSHVQAVETSPFLHPLNVLYDLTPAAFVSGIITELGIIPPTSVAVLLREMNVYKG